MRRIPFETVRTADRYNWQQWYDQSWRGRQTSVPSLSRLPLGASVLPGCPSLVRWKLAWLPSRCFIKCPHANCLQFCLFPLALRGVEMQTGKCAHFRLFSAKSLSPPRCDGGWRVPVLTFTLHLRLKRRCDQTRNLYEYLQEFQCSVRAGLIFGMAFCPSADPILLGPGPPAFPCSWSRGSGEMLLPHAGGGTEPWTRDQRGLSRTRAVGSL